MDLPPGLPLVQMEYEFKVELEGNNSSIRRKIYKLNPLESSKRQRSKSSTCLNMATSNRRSAPMEHRCFLHQRRMAVFDFASTTTSSIKRRSKPVIYCLYLRSCLIIRGQLQSTATLIFDPGIDK